jgi:hypothetical protein
MAAKSKPFVKSADSDVPVEKSAAAIKDLMRRYGASGFGTSEDYANGVVTVSFVLNTDDGQHVPVQIPARIQRVYGVMYGQPRAAGGDRYKNDKAVPTARREQAERTAWRQLHLLVEANLIAVQLGIMSIGEAFMAHTMVVSQDGRSERMADYLARTQGALGPGVRALLAAPVED